MQISDSEYRELIDARKQLAALEHGGVDNWEFYAEAMNEYHQDMLKEQQLDELIQSILEVASQHVDTPAGREAGYAVMGCEEDVKRLIGEYIKGLN